MQTTAKTVLQSNSRRPLVDRQAPVVEPKKPIISRYAQGHYNPGKERKHKVEHEINEFEASRGIKRTKTTLAVASVVPSSSKNFVGAAKNSLKEKQLLKEKRMRKTGTVVPKPQRSISSVASAKVVEDSEFKVPTALRHDSFYSQSHDSIQIDTVDPSENVENLVRVVAKPSASTKTIHVARASTKFRTSTTIVNTGSSASKSIPTPVVPKVVQPRVDQVSKVASSLPTPKITTKLPKSSILTAIPASAPAAVFKARLENSTSTSTTLLIKEHSLATKAIKFTGVDVRNNPFSTSKMMKKRTFSRKTPKLAINQDPMLVKEYEFEIYSYWREMEISLLPDPHYMFKQPDLDWGMRRTLVCWIIQVHAQFRLLPETLYLTVNLIDRTLSLKSISLSKLQLVGVAALLIASKYEEILSPSVQDLVYMTDYAYSSDEILSAERYLLGIISYQLGYPNPLNYLKRLGAESDHRVDSLSRYFLEVMLLDKQFIPYPSSLLAASAFFLSLKTIHSASWTPEFVSLIGYEESTLLPCVYGLLEYLKTDQYEPVFEKYAVDSFYGVSKAMRAFLHSKRLS